MNEVYILDSHNPQVTRKWLEAHKPRVIIKAIAGDDSIDLQACRELGVSVVRADYQHEIPCVEWCLRMLLEFEGARGREVCGKRAVVVGSAGRIGSKLEKALYALGVHTLSFDKKLDHSREDLLERLGKADYCFVCCPLTDETKGLIGRIELEALGSDGALICVSRALVCDFPAVSAFVAKGGRFAVDADDIDDYLVENRLKVTFHDRFFNTRHICGYTREAKQRRAEAISRVLEAINEPAGIVIQ